jgi:hypothetical protein
VVKDREKMSSLMESLEKEIGSKEELEKAVEEQKSRIMSENEN